MYHHSRVIVCIDIDCFYAQVEEINDPTIKNMPLVVQQQNLAVTSNYPAREKGIFKGMNLYQAKKMLPTLIVKNGEDIKKYRIVSDQIHNILKEYGPIEKLGLDENFIDITNKVNNYINENYDKDNIDDTIGHRIDDNNNRCRCGCLNRLVVGSIIANQMRSKLVNELQVTSTAGIAHNKLLAKLVGSTHKPNQQTTIYPNSEKLFLLTLKNISQIPGIGHVTAKKLEQAKLDTIDSIRYCSVEELQNVVGSKNFAIQIKDWCLGIDESPIKEQNQPNTIGCEDTIEKCFEIQNVLNYIKKLLTRVWDLVQDDGRKPEKVKLTIRKKNFNTDINERISRETTFDSNFIGQNSITMLNEIQITRFLSIFKELLIKIVNNNEKFEINLVGISFSNFKENNNNKRKNEEINENKNKKITTNNSKISNYFQKL